MQLRIWLAGYQLTMHLPLLNSDAPKLGLNEEKT